MFGYRSYNQGTGSVDTTDYGPEPFVVNIEKATLQNPYFRSTLWTGKLAQVTLMSIPAGGEIGLEIHPHVDQFLRIEAGIGLVKMGHSHDLLNYQSRVADGYAVIVPAGTWHNIINIGNRPIKLYSIYTPPQHPHGTVHKTKAEADAEEH